MIFPQTKLCGKFSYVYFGITLLEEEEEEEASTPRRITRLFAADFANADFANDDLRTRARAYRYVNQKSKDQRAGFSLGCLAKKLRC